MSRRTDRHTERQRPQCATCGRRIRDRDNVTRTPKGWKHVQCHRNVPKGTPS